MVGAQGLTPQAPGAPGQGQPPAYLQRDARLRNEGAGRRADDGRMYGMMLPSTSALNKLAPAAFAWAWAGEGDKLVLGRGPGAPRMTHACLTHMAKPRRRAQAFQQRPMSHGDGDGRARWCAGGRGHAPGAGNAAGRVGVTATANQSPPAPANTPSLLPCIAL